MTVPRCCRKISRLFLLLLARKVFELGEVAIEVPHHAEVCSAFLFDFFCRRIMEPVDLSIVAGFAWLYEAVIEGWMSGYLFGRLR